MTKFEPGLVHTPLTPFTADGLVDLATFARLIEVHINNGADAIAILMHAGEPVSLPDAEKREVISFAIRHAKGRLPVSIARS